MRPADRSALESLLASAPLNRVATVARRHPARVALVGGAIRDALVGRSFDDFDLVVEGELDAFLDRLAAEFGRRPTWIGDRFQRTHRFRLRGRQVDLSAANGTLESDLGRRDFTINAMAVVLGRGGTPELLDPNLGLADLAGRVLRETAPGVLDADPLRVLRAVRYACELDLEIEPATRAEIIRRSPQLEGVASERLVAEWQAILGGARWADCLQLAVEIGATHGSFGDIGPGRAVDRVGASDAVGEALRLAAVAFDRLAVDACGPEPWIAQKWPARAARRAFRVAAMAHELISASPDRMIGWALEDSGAARDAVALVRLLDDSAEATCAGGRLDRFCTAAEQPRWVRGDDLVAWGMPPGPDLGALLERVARGQVGGEWQERSEARGWARHQVESGGMS